LFCYFIEDCIVISQQEYKQQSKAAQPRLEILPISNPYWSLPNSWTLSAPILSCPAKIENIMMMARWPSGPQPNFISSQFENVASIEMSDQDGSDLD